MSGKKNNYEEVNIVFNEIEDIVNNNREMSEDGGRVELEPAAQIDTDLNGKQTVFPGIHIIVPGSEIPVFISNGELRLLADASDKYIESLMNKEKTNSKPKKKKV